MKQTEKKELKDKRKKAAEGAKKRLSKFKIKGLNNENK